MAHSRGLRLPCNQQAATTFLAAAELALAVLTLLTDITVQHPQPPAVNILQNGGTAASAAAATFQQAAASHKNWMAKLNLHAWGILLLLRLTHLVPAAHRPLVQSLLLGNCWRGAIASSSHWGCLGGGCHVDNFQRRACSQIRLASQGRLIEPKVRWRYVVPACPAMPDYVRCTEGLCAWMQGRGRPRSNNRESSTVTTQGHSPLAAWIAVIGPGAG